MADPNPEGLPIEEVGNNFFQALDAAKIKFDTTFEPTPLHSPEVYEIRVTDAASRNQTYTGIQLYETTQPGQTEPIMLVFQPGANQTPDNIGLIRVDSNVTTETGSATLFTPQIRQLPGGGTESFFESHMGNLQTISIPDGQHQSTVGVEGGATVTIARLGNKQLHDALIKTASQKSSA